jgi:two-component system phosphate regulon sensor histidine kinase PhoR
MLRSRILWKLYAGYVVLIFLSTIVVGILVSKQVGKETLFEIERSLDVRASLLSETALESFSLTSNLMVQERVRILGNKTNTRFTIVNSDGKVLADSEEDPGSMDNHINRPEILAARSHGFGMATRLSKTMDTKMMYFALSIKKEGNLLGYVRTSLPLLEIDNRLSRVRNIVLLGMGVSMFVALLLGFFVSRGFAKPLTAMTVVAESISEGNYDQRVSINRNDEIGSLANTLNKMAKISKERMETITLDNNKLLAILAGMVEGVVAVDKNETIIHLNASAGRILSVFPEENLNRKIWEVTQSQELCQVISEALSKKIEIRKKLQIITPSKDQTAEVHASPFHNATGGLVGVVAVLYDVSELERLESIRRDFVSNVSHELKTPITAIRGLVETVIDDEQMSPEKQKSFLLKTMEQTLRLSTIVTDLLVLSRLESGGVDLNREPIDLREVVDASMQALLPISDEKSIHIESQVPEKPVEVLGDREALYQTINNLLDNAVKYNSKKGTASVRLRIENGNAVIDVQDTGIGIEPLEKPKIFERFYRVDKARSRQLGGTGLGLSIVKHTILAHGGQLSVESTQGIGSTFQISIPLIKPS